MDTPYGHTMPLFRCVRKNRVEPKNLAKVLIVSALCAIGCVVLPTEFMVTEFQYRQEIRNLVMQLETHSVGYYTRHNKALVRTQTPLRSICAAQLGRNVEFLSHIFL